jgi:hypothetical protein
MFNYGNLTTNVKMTRSTIQTPGLKCASLFTSGLMSQGSAIIQAWQADAANQFKAIVEVKETTIQTMAGAIASSLRNVSFAVVSFTAATRALMLTSYEVWRAANPNKNVLRTNYGCLDAGEHNLIVEYATETLSESLSAGTAYYCINIYYYDYSPVTVPDPSQGMAVPPPCACGS